MDQRHLVKSNQNGNAAIALLAFLLLALLGIVFYTLINNTKNPKRDELRIVEENNISYGPDNLMKLDVKSNINYENAPIVVLVHGGGWVEGDKKDISTRFGDFFYDNGFVVASTNYRLSQKGGLNTFPIPINDVACAVAWTKKNTARMGGDPDKIFLMGHSAGAHIAAMIAYNGERDWQSDCSIKEKFTIKGFWGDSGAYDWELTPDHWQIPVFLGNLNSSQKWGETEPINFPSAGDPPALLTAGDQDFFANFQNSAKFAQALERANVPVTLHLYPGFDHTGFQKNFRKDTKLQNDVLKFFNPLISK